MINTYNQTTNNINKAVVHTNYINKIREVIIHSGECVTMQ